jgi:hypothetical protein
MGESTVNKDIVKKAGFEKELELVENGQCPFCEKDVSSEKFEDDLSIKEFNISGLCQKCQNGFFTENPDPKFCTFRRETYIGATRAREKLTTVGLID